MLTLQNYVGNVQRNLCRSSLSSALLQMANLQRAETRLGALVTLTCARPSVVFRARYQPCFHRIVLDIGGDSVPFAFIAHPPIIRLCLPERLSCAAEE